MMEEEKLLALFYWWENHISERLSDLTKVIYLVHSRAENGAWVFPEKILTLEENVIKC